jgi:hypothetical protein
MTVEHRAPRRALRRWMPALACAGALSAAVVPVTAQASARSAASTSSSARTSAAATLEQCVTASNQIERSATFVGEMTAVPGTTRMMMRIEVLERMPKEAFYRAISYPGLGAWLKASTGVKTYKNLNKVTDLAAPAAYRAAIHFRWVGAKGRTIKTLELRTPRCEQPLAPRMPASGSLTAPPATNGTTPAASG